MAEDNTTSNGTAFTETDRKLLVCVMQNLTSDIQFNAQAVATQMGYKDAGIARVRWNQVRRAKLAAGSASTGAGVKKRSPVKKDSQKKDSVLGDAPAGGDDDEEGAAKTPSKTPTKRGRKPKAEGKGKNGIKEEMEEDRTMETINEAGVEFGLD